MNGAYSGRLRTKILVGGMGVVCAAVAAGRDLSDLARPIEGEIHEVSVRLDGAGRVVRNAADVIGNGGLETVYDNTCSPGYFLNLQAADVLGGSQSLAIGDWGGVPSGEFAGNPACTPGCADSYDIRAFTIGYCTGAGVPLDMVLHFWAPPQDSCTPGSKSLIGGTVPPSTPTLASYTITGLPRSSTQTSVATCYIVQIDLGASGFEMPGGTELQVGSTMGDRFAWSMQILNTTGGEGPIAAGIIPFAGCNVCAGTIWEIGRSEPSPGIGLGHDSHLFLDDYGGTNFSWSDDCFFGGSDGFQGMYMTLQAFDPSPSPTPTFCDDTDGSLASCPCGNAGGPDSGCDIPQGTGGVSLSLLAQATNPNGATLQGNGYSPMGSPTAIVIRSSSLDPASPVVFGDGLRCVNTAPLVRLGAASAAGGSSTHVFGHGPVPGSGTFYYQIWFRSTPSSFCDPLAAFNLSNGVELDW